jgi:hypothetical protein
LPRRARGSLTPSVQTGIASQAANRAARSARQLKRHEELKRGALEALRSGRATPRQNSDGSECWIG